MSKKHHPKHVKPVVAEEVMPEVQPEAQELKAEVELQNLEAYKKVVGQIRDELVKLVAEGHMSQQVAQTVLDQKSHEAFNKIVAIAVR